MGLEPGHRHGACARVERRGGIGLVFRQLAVVAVDAPQFPHRHRATREGQRGEIDLERGVLHLLAIVVERHREDAARQLPVGHEHLGVGGGDGRIAPVGHIPESVVVEAPVDQRVARAIAVPAIPVAVVEAGPVVEPAPHAALPHRIGDLVDAHPGERHAIVLRRVEGPHPVGRVVVDPVAGGGVVHEGPFAIEPGGHPGKRHERKAVARVDRHAARRQPEVVLQRRQPHRELPQVQAVVGRLEPAVGQPIGHAVPLARPGADEEDVPVDRSQATFREGTLRQPEKIVLLRRAERVFIPFRAEVVLDSAVARPGAIAHERERVVDVFLPAGRERVERLLLADLRIGLHLELAPHAGPVGRRGRCREPLRAVVGFLRGCVGVLLVRTSERAVLGVDRGPPALREGLEGGGVVRERERSRAGQLGRLADDVVAEHDRGLGPRLADDFVGGHVVGRHPALVAVCPPIEAALFVADPDVGIERADGQSGATRSELERAPKPACLLGCENLRRQRGEVAAGAHAVEGLRLPAREWKLEPQGVECHGLLTGRGIREVHRHEAVLLDAAGGREEQPRAGGLALEGHPPRLLLGDLEAACQIDQLFLAADHGDDPGRRSEHRLAVRRDRPGQADGIERERAAPDADRILLDRERRERLDHPLRVADRLVPPAGKLLRLVALLERPLHGPERLAIGQVHRGRDRVSARLQLRQLEERLEGVVGDGGQRARDDRSGLPLAGDAVPYLLGRPWVVEIIRIGHEADVVAHGIEAHGHRKRLLGRRVLHPVVGIAEREEGVVAVELAATIGHAKRDASFVLAEIPRQLFSEAKLRRLPRRDLELRLLFEQRHGLLRIGEIFDAGLHVERDGLRRRVVGADPRCGHAVLEAGQFVHRHLHGGRVFDERHRRPAGRIEVAAAQRHRRLKKARDVVEGEQHLPGVAGAIRADEFEILRRHHDLPLPPAASQGGGAGRGEPHGRFEVGPPVAEDLADRHPPEVAVGAEAGDEKLVGVVGRAFGDVLAHRPEVKLHPVVEGGGRAGRAAAHPRLVAGHDPGAAGDVEIVGIPRQEIGGGPHDELVAAGVLRCEAADRESLLPLRRIDRAVGNRGLGHLRHGKHALLVGRDCVAVLGKGDGTAAGGQYGRDEEKRLSHDEIFLVVHRGRAKLAHAIPVRRENLSSD